MLIDETCTPPQKPIADLVLPGALCKNGITAIPNTLAM